MAERVTGTPERAVVMVSSAWWAPRSEAAFVTRAVAGALSRFVAVEVVAPTGGDSEAVVTADGLFDVRAVARTDLDPVAGIVVAGDDAAASVLAAAYPSAARVVLSDGTGPARSAHEWSPALSARTATAGIGLHVAVNPLASERPHNGLGFVDYLLVLSDRGGNEHRRDDDLTDGARWLAAAFSVQHVVVVEGGVATVWRRRALRGVVTVDTRTDLWRLMAHARAVVDLRPGPLVARECVEALRFATPVIAPAGTVAARLADAGGGLSYRDVDELLGCVDRVGDPGQGAALGAQGRAITDTWYGDAGAFVQRVGDALATLTVSA